MTESKVRRVLVTGASGFVGSRLCEQLIANGYSVRAAVREVRSEKQVAADSLQHVVVPDLLHFADWSQLLHGIDAVVHLVARTHVTDEFGAAAMQEYRRINVDLTRRLAKAANRHAVSRFVYLSSIKAVGNGANETYTEQTPTQPEDSYGKSKLEAEQELKRTFAEDYVVLRPPLVYGPNVQGNFLRLMQLVQRGIPLPSVNNARSMVHVDNLVGAIELSLRSPHAANKTFHCCDPEPISTTDLIRNMAKGLDCPCRLVSMPEFFLRGLGRLAGKTEEIKRLVGSLTVSNELLTRQLNWRPKFTTADGVVQTGREFRQSPWSQKLKTREAATDMAQGNTVHRRAA